MTREILEERFKTSHMNALNNKHFASLPQPLFGEDGSFNKNNWNSGQDIIREDLDDIICPNNELLIEFGDIDSFNFDFIHSKIIFCNDQWTVLISIIDEDDDVYDSYVTTWYKSRGTTSAITKNGKMINIKEYVDLITNLENVGYFDKKNWKYK